ncbi:MAG: hypothetical protein AAGA81_07965 [Acidobacteriota bacterium]
MLRPSDDLDLVLVTTDLSELTVAKSLLASEGIPFLVTGEESARLLAAPLLSPLLGERVLGARLFVRHEDADFVREVLVAVSDPP